MSSNRHRLNEQERSSFDELGFLIRTCAFEATELGAIASECEALVSRLALDRRARRARYGSYTFDLDSGNDVVIKWEGDSDVVHGLEPFAHLSPVLETLAYDPRLLEPMMDIVGTDSPTLFTEKLNLKRPFRGGENPLHQDHPYWAEAAAVAADVSTAMLFLDDATLENGCLEVVPGSQRDGEWPRRKTDDLFAANELDATAFGTLNVIPIEVPAGSVVFFGPLLVHRSAPNRSAAERRALLFSYQPPGRRTQLENLRRLGRRSA